eukprot:PLAT3676.3.p1 GENE.PLAT3676.3~~PLAT3676.3.p1  ORF type:complete len:947 (-),score=459.44 PLAT3676.3:1196-4036(-)
MDGMALPTPHRLPPVHEDGSDAAYDGSDAHAAADSDAASGRGSPTLSDSIALETRGRLRLLLSDASGRAPSQRSVTALGDALVRRPSVTSAAAAGGRAAAGSTPALRRLSSASESGGGRSFLASIVNTWLPRRRYARARAAREALLNDALLSVRPAQLRDLAAAFSYCEDRLVFTQFADLLRNVLLSLPGSDAASGRSGRAGSLALSPLAAAERHSGRSGGRRRASRRRSSGKSSVAGGSPTWGGHSGRSGRSVEAMDEGNLTLGLLSVFQEVDKDGTGAVTWSEFSSYLLEKGSAKRNPHVFQVDTIALYSERALPALRATASHKPVSQLLYAAALGAIVVLRARTEAVQLFNISDGALRKTLHCRAQPLSVLHVACKATLVIGAGDNTLYLHSTAGGRKLWKIVARWHPAMGAATALAWADAPHELLLAGIGGGGSIYAMHWADGTPAFRLDGHSSTVTALRLLPGLNYVASASLDHSVRVWDLYTRAQRQVYEGHRGGVHCLTYDAGSKLLVSGGADRAVRLWSCQVSRGLLTLHGHAYAVVAAAFVPGTRELITGDSSGVVKVWDSANYRCVQTIKCEQEHTRALTAMAVCQPTARRLVLAATALSFWEQGKPHERKATEARPVIAALFNATNLSIVTASERTLKVWDAVSADVLRVYWDAMPSNITALALDSSGRKLAVADYAGNVHVLSYSVGRLLHELRPHTALVSGLAAFPAADGRLTLLSLSWDGSLAMHDATTGVRRVHLRSGHSGDVSAAAISEATCLAATASHDATIQLWDYEGVRLEATLTHDAPVLATTFLDPLPLLASACDDGTLCIWATQLPGRRYQLLLRLPLACQPPAAVIAAAATAAARRRRKRQLVRQAARQSARVAAGRHRTKHKPSLPAAAAAAAGHASGFALHHPQQTLANWRMSQQPSCCDPTSRRHRERGHRGRTSCSQAR